MSNPLSEHCDEICDAFAGTRLQQAIVAFVTLAGLFTDGPVPAVIVKGALRISDEQWERAAKSLYDDAVMWRQDGDNYITGLVHTLARYATAGVGGRPPEKHWLRLRRKKHREVFEHMEPQCLACGAQGVTLALDHIHPVDRGGSNHPLNFMWLCVPCNSSKGTKTWEEWRARK